MVEISTCAGPSGSPSGAGDVLQDGIEQRAQIRAGGVQIQRRRTLAGGNVENRVFDGAFVGFEVNLQVEDSPTTSSQRASGRSILLMTISTFSFSSTCLSFTTT